MGSRVQWWTIPQNHWSLSTRATHLNSIVKKTAVSMHDYDKPVSHFSQRPLNIIEHFASSISMCRYYPNNWFAYTNWQWFLNVLWDICMICITQHIFIMLLFNSSCRNWLMCRSGITRKCHQCLVVLYISLRKNWWKLLNQSHLYFHTITSSSW